MAFTFFFRDLQTLNLVRDYVVPVLKTRRYMYIWDAGCAMGPEPYTLAIILRENMGNMMFRNVKILATDIDNSNLFEDIIVKGIYPDEQVSRIPKDIFEKYFVSVGNGNFQIVEEIRKSLQFQKHNLLTLQAPRKQLGLIVCKNVLLHFTEEERINVYNMFHDALDEGGFLVNEQTQKMPPELEHKWERVVSNAQLFRKK